MKQNKQKERNNVKIKYKNEFKSTYCANLRDNH